MLQSLWHRGQKRWLDASVSVERSYDRLLFTTFLPCLRQGFAGALYGSWEALKLSSSMTSVYSLEKSMIGARVQYTMSTRFRARPSESKGILQPSKSMNPNGASKELYHQNTQAESPKKRGKHGRRSIERKGKKQQHYWQRKSTAGVGTKARGLIEIVLPLSNVKEEIYGALDEWVAFEEEFPVVAVRKALEILKDMGQWQRIIQVSKWMLSKGQGMTMGTYYLILKAYDMEARLEEAEALWGKLIGIHTRSMPRMMFARMIAMYDRHELPEKIFKVFAQMEELEVKPDEGTVYRLGQIYQHMNMTDEQEELLNKYPKTWEYHQFKW